MKSEAVRNVTQQINFQNSSPLNAKQKQSSGGAEIEVKKHRINKLGRIFKNEGKEPLVWAPIMKNKQYIDH